MPFHYILFDKISHFFYQSTKISMCISCFGNDPRSSICIWEKRWKRIEKRAFQNGNLVQAGKISPKLAFIYYRELRLKQFLPIILPDFILEFYCSVSFVMTDLPEVHTIKGRPAVFHSRGNSTETQKKIVKNPIRTLNLDSPFQFFFGHWMYFGQNLEKNISFFFRCVLAIWTPSFIANLKICTNFP